MGEEDLLVLSKQVPRRIWPLRQGGVPCSQVGDSAARDTPIASAARPSETVRIAQEGALGWSDRCGGRSFCRAGKSDEWDFRSLELLRHVCEAMSAARLVDQKARRGV